ncbi:hypothetical protein [Shouchella clausii]|uniref:hypothetical protein n=1 Tax=Shouchella clausii TaxID=79880 RepID=UPI0031CC6D6A
MASAFSSYRKGESITVDGGGWAGSHCRLSTVHGVLGQKANAASGFTLVDR